MRRRAGISRGFSLIEALVALGIAAAVITGFYASLSTGLQLRAKAGAQAEAVLLAATVMDRVGVDIPLRIGMQMEGEAEAGAWSLVISNRPPSDMSAVLVGNNTLAFISVAVTGPQEVVLRSMRYLQSPI